jgi:AcrR family transcriptional regulator
MSQQREQIAEAFERLVSRVGYAKANLDDLSRELHISKKTIYVHFAGKREIYAHVVERQARLEQAKLRAMVAHEPSSRQKVAMLLRFVIGSARAHIAETGEQEWLAEYEVAADVFAKANVDLLREIVEQGIAAGEFAQGDPDLVEKMVAAMVLQYTVIVNSAPDYDRDEELVERILRFVG